MKCRDGGVQLATYEQQRQGRMKGEVARACTRRQYGVALWRVGECARSRVEAVYETPAQYHNAMERYLPLYP